MYIGRTPTPAPLTSSDIADSIITDAKIVGMTSSKLSGALPAISGASLTGLATDFVSLSSQTASGVADVDFEGLFTDTYKSYMLLGIDVVMGTDNNYIAFRIKRDGQSSYDNSSNEYKYIGDRFRQGADLPSKVEETAGSVMRTRLNGDDTQSHCFRAFIFPRNSNHEFKMFMNCVGDNTSNQLQYDMNVMCRKTNAAVQSLKVLSTSGNISGTFKLYGMK
jgi:hypothetical protein